MASIRTAIELRDNFTGVLYRVIDSVNLSLAAMGDLNQTMGASVDMVSMEAARDSINQATIAVRELDEAMQGLDVPATVRHPENSPAPVMWQADSMGVFTSSGVERFGQEVQGVNSMLEQLCATQDAIAKQAYNTDLFPPEAARNLNSLAVRMDMVRNRIKEIEGNPFNMGVDAVNGELEQLRAQLDQAVREQENLNRAVEGMDVQAANEAYLRLSKTVGNTERYIRDNVDGQGRFNREVSQGTEEASRLTDMIKGAVAAYATVHTFSAALGLSDQMTETAARLNLMNDGLQTTQELQDMIYLSAQRSRGSYQATADAVSKLGLMAGDAFGSSEEIIAFMEQINKQFKIAGTEAGGIDAAMLQLTQAMGSGVLRGEEYNSILEQAPNIIQTIADYMEVPKGQLKDMAAEGQITADIVKAAIFAAMDETNAAFESMPVTFGQVWTSFQNTAQIAFRPVLQQLNELANSVAFQEFVGNAAEALSAVAGAVLEIFDLLVGVAGLVSDNWSWLAPIIYGVAAALTVYYGAMLLYNTVTGISTGITAAKAFAEKVHAASLAMESGAAFTATAAQYGLNAALLACPITWIILAIIALIAVIAVLANYFSGTGHIAQSAFGVVCGGVNVGIQFIKNLGLTVANIALGIGAAIGACGQNLMTAFHNAISSVCSWWYDLLSTALEVVEKICASLNRLPFVSFDYSGISNAADDYAAKAAAAANNKSEYASISEAFHDGISTYDTFQEGWVMDAYRAGASWGDGITEKVENFFSDHSWDDGIPDPEDYENLGDYGSGMAWDLDNIAADTGTIKDSVAVTGEELKYLRDIAEQEVVNRYTTGEITVEQTNYNTVTGAMDLDGIIDGLVDSANEAANMIAEGAE